MVQFGRDIGVQTRRANFLRKQFEQIAANIEEGADIALQRISVEIYERSRELVPVDTGRLKSSSFIKKLRRGTASAGVAAKGIGKSPTYTVGYNASNTGGEFLIRPRNTNAFYAVYVHENHPSKSGFLLQALQEKKNDFPRIVVDEVKTKIFKRIKFK